MERLILIVFTALCLLGCSETAGKKDPEIRRICSLSAAATHILNKLGAPPAAVDRYSLITALPSTPAAGKGTALSAERLLQLKIDTLLVWSYQKNALEHLTRYGIEIVTVEPFRSSNFAEQVRRLGRLTGKEKNCEKIIAEHNRIFETLKKKESPEKRVYFELYSRNRGAGDDSCIGDLLRAAGGKSILKKTALAGTEYIIAQDPEVIFFVEGFGSVSEIMKRGGFSAVEAVKRKAVYPVPRHLTVEGAFTVEAVKYLKERMK